MSIWYFEGGDRPRHPLAVGQAHHTGDVRQFLDREQRGADTEERHPVGPVHQRSRRHQGHQGGRLPALGGGDDHDVVHLGIDNVHPLRVFFGNVLDGEGEHQARVLAVVDVPGLTPPAQHQVVGALTDLQRGQPDLVRRAHRIGQQRLPDHVE
jgi:hypothetical protein